MLTTDDYYSAAPADRNALKRELGEATHRGTPVPRAIEGYRLEMRQQAGRKPTHRGVPRSA